MNLAAMLSTLLCLGIANAVVAQSHVTAKRKFERQLNLPANIIWSQVPLKKALESLTETRNVAYWLDRRLDPTTPISFSGNTTTLRECLLQLSDETEMIDVAWIGNVVYVGPHDAANRLATINQLHTEQLRKLNAAQRSKLLRMTNVQWPRLTTPRQLIDALEQRLGVTVTGKGRVVHDLWPERTLPRIRTLEQLELLLAGFDLSFQLKDDGGINVIPMPRTPKASWNVRIPTSRHNAVQTVLGQRESASMKGNVLTGTWRDNEAIKSAIASATEETKSDAAPKAQLRYTLSVEAKPFAPLVNSLCRQLNIECQLGELSASARSRRISFDVEEATQEQLLAAIANAAKLGFKVSGTTVTFHESK